MMTALGGPVGDDGVSAWALEVGAACLGDEREGRGDHAR